LTEYSHSRAASALFTTPKRADTDDQCHDWANEINPQGRSYFTHHLSAHLGPPLNGTQAHVQSYADGRVLRVDVELDQPRTYIFLYAPGCNKGKRRQAFFNSIARIFPTTGDVVVAGDFNAVDCKLKDKQRGQLKGVTGGTREWASIRKSLHLHDEWRRRFPDKVTMSWVRTGMTTSTRIDRVEMSKQIGPTDYRYMDSIFRGSSHWVDDRISPYVPRRNPSPLSASAVSVAAGGSVIPSR
jgi:hypothetical protein